MSIEGVAQVIGNPMASNQRAINHNRIVFHAPGLQRYRTSEYARHNKNDFAAISVTGESCSLNCEHCKTNVLKGMHDLKRQKESLYDVCSRLHAQGTRGVLISGGSDKQGRVPLRRHIPDLIRVRRDLNMVIRVHPGLPDEETCEGLAEADIDGAMVDIIGDTRTIAEVYHLKTDIHEYEAVLERLQRHGVPCVPHIILGLHYGQMLGEQNALNMISRYELKLLVLVILTPLSSTPMAAVIPPSTQQVTDFFKLARHTLPNKNIMLGCARPLGPYKAQIDRAAIDTGLNGIAYPAEGIVSYARARGLQPEFIDACCGVSW